MGERKRLDLDSQMLENLEKQVTDQVTKSVKDSFRVGLRSLIQPLQRANPNTSTRATERPEARRINSKGKKAEEEPTTPGSLSNSRSFGKPSYDRADKNKTVKSSIQTIRSPKSNPSSIIWKGWDSTDERRFKIRCNLRVSFSGAKTTPFSRQVYAMDCDNDCQKFAEVGVNSYGKFENCYKSSFQDRRELDMDDEDHCKERCDLRVFFNRSTCHQCPCHNREIYVMQCSGDCGKLCESQETWKEMLETFD